MNVQYVSVWKVPLYSKAIVFGLVTLMTVAEPLGIRTRDCSLARVQHAVTCWGHSFTVTHFHPAVSSESALRLHKIKFVTELRKGS